MNAIGERNRPFNEAREQQVLMKYEEVYREVRSMMRSLASMKGSQFSMQRLEEILRDKVTRQGYGSGAEKIAYEMCQEMQVYMQQAQRNKRLVMQQ